MRIYGESGKVYRLDTDNTAAYLLCTNEIDGILVNEYEIDIACYDKNQHNYTLRIDATAYVNNNGVDLDSLYAGEYISIVDYNGNTVDSSQTYVDCDIYRDSIASAIFVRGH